jgi:hypothetical protein
MSGGPASKPASIFAFANGPASVRISNRDSTDANSIWNYLQDTKGKIA